MKNKEKKYKNCINVEESKNYDCYRKQLQRLKTERNNYKKKCHKNRQDRIKYQKALEAINLMLDTMDAKGRGFYTREEFIKDFVLIINKVKTTLGKKEINRFKEV